MYIQLLVSEIVTAVCAGCEKIPKCDVNVHYVCV